MKTGSSQHTIAGIALLLLCLVFPVSGSALGRGVTLRGPPHHNAVRLADQLRAEATSAESVLRTLPAPQSESERSIARSVAAFSARAQDLARLLGREPSTSPAARDLIGELTTLAWRVHGALGKSPRYSSLLEPWARAISVLRRLNPR